jgi:hypothetical protein
MTWRNYYCHACPGFDTPICWSSTGAYGCKALCPQCHAKTLPYRSVEVDDEVPPRSKKMSKVQKDPDIRFLHLRETAAIVTKQGKHKDAPVTKGGTTVAYKLDGDVVFYAFASCHPTDNYNFTSGRNKAAGRIHSARFVKQFPAGGVTDNADLAKLVVTHVNSDLAARRAASASAH